MTNQIFKPNPILKIVHSTLVSLPAPSNLSLIWNIGSLLFLCLIIQIFSGILIAATYTVSIDIRFSQTTLFIERNSINWLLRYTHANGASLFFLCLYVHTGRGIYYSSSSFHLTWISGVTILLLCIATAFLGYVLPLNQISFWGASVITNLFSEVPYIGPDLVQLIWGGARISTPTITRFFDFHFILPFVILALVIIHITFLHITGSSNPIGVSSNLDKIPFHPYFTIKDIIGILIVLLAFSFICLYTPLILGDNENFTPANPSRTPHHIQPEWYFLFAYAILRAVPNKLGGVIALAGSILILYILPFTRNTKFKRTIFYPPTKFLFWLFCVVTILLTWLGICPVEPPYIALSQIFSVVYFSYFLANPLIKKLWELIYTT